uniref:SRCR domain-containing protein n=1 Tax=Sphaeramia orbicularis TaxID=375764 RepID=A0A673B8D7_9TELE
TNSFYQVAYLLQQKLNSHVNNVKLVNGSNRCSGRVELYHNNQWRRVCNSGWGKEEADLACRLAECGSSVDQSDVLDFGEAHGLSGVKANCSGNEESLFECTLQKFQESCVDATVVCSNAKPIRLVGGNNRCSGRVEMYAMGEWGTVCDDGWGFEDAMVACRQMNCGNALSAKSGAFFGSGGGRILIDEIDCIGNETSLSDCRHRGLSIHDCRHTEDAGVICTESIRLIGGTDPCSGSLEVLHGGRWGKICNNNWGPREDKMLCYELSCGAPIKTHDTPIYRENSGQRSYLSNCSVDVNSIANCIFTENPERCEGVSLSCKGKTACSDRKVKFLHKLNVFKNNTTIISIQCVNN